MSRRHVYFSLALVLIAAGACDRALPIESRSSAGSTARLDRAADQPFRLTLTGNANPDFSQGPCSVVNVESGTGVAEHLGRVTWTSNEVADFCVDPNNPNTGTVTGTMVITAANGDQLTQSYTTTVNVVGGTLTATGSYTVTGGTGRFADASGAGTVDVTGSLAPPFGVSGTFSGTLSY